MNEGMVLSPQRYYETYGYYIWRGLINSEQIDALVSEYQRKVLPAKAPFFRQNTSRYEKNVLTPTGLSNSRSSSIHQYHNYPNSVDAR